MNIIKTKLITLAFVALVSAGFTACESGKDAPKAAITMDQAQQTALPAVPGGAINDAEYEKQGEQWVYSFDLKFEGVIRQVWVDPQSGKIIKDEAEKK